MWIRSVLGAAISDSGWCLDESVKPWRQHRYERLGKGSAQSSFVVPVFSLPARLCRFAPRVAMVQPAQSWKRNHCRVCLRLSLDWSALRRVLPQRVVNPVLVVIADVVPKQTHKMTLVQSNDMIQELTAAASYPTLGSSIPPGRLRWVSIRSPARTWSRNHRTLRFDPRSHADRSPLPENAARSCCTTQSADGCRVTLKCRILRRACSITKKQYSN